MESTENTEKISLEEYFNNDEMAISIVKKKYLEYPEQPIDEYFKSVLDHIANNSAENAEKDKEAFIRECHKDWVDGVWKGAGSILAASVQEDKKVSVFNCTGLVIHEDSLDAIMDTRKWATKMAAHRQGLGILFNALRPRGTKINNSAEVSEGAVHWMKSFDRIGYEAGQRNRMPAILMALSVEHPDIEEFITCKDSITEICNANISVQVTDSFMRKVINNENYFQTFEFENGEVLTKEVPAQRIFDLICKQAWKNGEPGIQFIDHMREWSIQEALGYSIQITNACVSGDTGIMTKMGEIPAKDLVGQTRYVWSSSGWWKSTIKVAGHNKDLYRVYFSNGKYLDCTEDHVFFTSNKRPVLCKHLSVGTPIAPFTCPFVEIPNMDLEAECRLDRFFLQGLYSGSATKGTLEDGRVQIDVLRDYMHTRVRLDPNVEKSEPFTKEDGNIYVTLSFYPEADKEYVPYVEASISERQAWIMGFLDACGEVFPDNGKDAPSKSAFRVRVRGYSEKFVRAIQKMCTSIGVHSSVLAFKEDGTTVPFTYATPDGTEAVFILSSRHFKSSVQRHPPGISPVRLMHLRARLHESVSQIDDTITVYDVIHIGVADTVYCFNLEESHIGMFNGIMTGQCSEKPLSDQSVCCLAPLNMEKVPHPFKETDAFHAFMQSVVYRMVRFMDDVIQYELDRPYKSPTEKQARTIKDLREVGLGILNLHKFFYQNNVKYGSEESIKLTEEFFKWYAYYAFKASVRLAKERGPCDAWKKTQAAGHLRTFETPYLQHLFKEFPELEELYYSVGIRNAALLSVAPTGSISMTFPGALSAGIEPLMHYAYWRKTRALNNNKEYEYFFVLPNIIKQLTLEALEPGTDDYRYIENLLPSQSDQDGEIGKRAVDIIKNNLNLDLLVPAHEVDPFQKIKLMSVAQKYIDAAISVTFNLPFDFTEEDTKKLYIEAWKNKLKSITVYRDGSRDGVYIFKDPVSYAQEMKEKYGVSTLTVIQRPEDIEYHYAPKRPAELPCEIHHTMIKGENWVVLVGTLSGSPYEVFAGKKNEDFNISKNFRKGILIKKSRGVYTLRIPTKNSYVEYHNITELFMNEEYKCLTRLVSLSLRHGVYSEYVVEQLKKSSDFVADFMAVVSRILSRYVSQKERDTHEKCPQCGALLVRHAGCTACSEDCGYSKCE